MTRLVLVVLGICAVLLSPGLAGGASASSSQKDKAAAPEAPVPVKEVTPQERVGELHDVLLDVMKNADALGVKGRFDRLEPRLDRVYDFDRMIQASTGSYWRAASAEQKKRLLESFRRFSISTYASEFNGYSGESFTILGERPGPRGTVLVDTQIERQAKPPVPLVYVLQPSVQNKEWRIFDVLLDGSISELARRYSEYRAILEKGGADSLATILDAKSEQLLSATAGSATEQH